MIERDGAAQPAPLAVRCTSSAAPPPVPPPPPILPAIYLGFADNFQDLSAYRDGVYWGWMANSAFYAVVGALLSTVVSAFSGYALATYRFRGREHQLAAALAAAVLARSPPEQRRDGFPTTIDAPQIHSHGRRVPRPRRFDKVG